MDAVELLDAAYRPLLALASEIDDKHGWLATRLPGWSVRDLLFHLASDSQRALVALGTPATGPADCDSISYWSEWRPNTPAALDGLRGTRIMASAWSSVRGPAGLFSETATAVVNLFRSADPAAVVVTQGRRITVDSLIRTLCVEAAVHHTDLEVVLSRPPHPDVLAEVRQVLDGLLGMAAPRSWDSLRYLLIGTGRAALSDDEVAQLGHRSSAFPLFG